MSKIEITKFETALGATVSGIQLGQAQDTEIETIKQALDDNLVLVFHNQTMTDDELVATSAKFGKLDIPGVTPTGKPFHAEHPEINVISNIVVDGQPAGNLGAGEAVWHADMTYKDDPPRAAVLYALEIPPAGGSTYFANMYAAYEALPENLKEAIEGKTAIHDASHNSAGILRKGYDEVTDVRETPGARHPLARTNPVTGRRALFLGRRPRSYVPGLSVADSDALLDQLWAHATQERFVYRHNWAVGDVLMWSNLEVLHRRDPFDASARRRMHRTQIGSYWTEAA
ncbi:MAG: TauD/TfdA family dioxygenase [Pseudomonadota bacterium]